MCTPSACSSLTSELAARNQSSSATTARKASRFVVTAGKPALSGKRITSPKIARVPTPVRSARSSPSSSALRRIARYCRTGPLLRADATEHATASADPADGPARVAQDLAAQVLQRTLEADEPVIPRERDPRRRRIARPRLHAEHVVADGPVDELAVGSSGDFDVREGRRVPGDELAAPRSRDREVGRLRLGRADVGL